MVQHIKVGKVTISELFLALSVQLIDMHTDKEDDNSVTQILSQYFLVDLVVEQLALLFRANLVRELTPTNSVANGDHIRSKHIEGTTEDDRKSCHAHD